MDFDFNKLRDKIEEQGRLVLAGILVIGFALFMVVFWTSLPSPMGAGQRTAPKKIEFDFSVFEEERFERLEVFDGASVPDEVGRDNPFSSVPPEAEEETEEEAEEEAPEEATPEEETPEEET